MASSPSAPILELVGVGKRFGDGTPALDGVDLDVRAGELVSVVGPPGCGKTTLLRIAAGLVGPTTGMLALRTHRIAFCSTEAAPLSLAARPELVLLDEPFGALDTLTRHRRTNELAQRYLAWGFAALLATRSVTEAILLSCRVVVLSARPGRVLRTVPVPFAYPRPSRLRFSSAFARLATETSDCYRPPTRTDRW
jgi:ABC-type nitrate/sulfonate/bicarbonate transport system ATPase subunit